MWLEVMDATSEVVLSAFSVPLPGNLGRSSAPDGRAIIHDKGAALLTSDRAINKKNKHLLLNVLDLGLLQHAY